MAVETRWRAAADGAAEAGRDALVVEVLDEAQPQRGLRAGRQRADQRLERVVVVLRLGDRGGRRRRSAPRAGGRAGGRARSWW